MAGRTAQKKSNGGVLQNIVLKLMPQVFSILQRSQSSVEIKQNTKGVVEFTIKSYGDSIEEAQAAGYKAFVDLKKQINEEIPTSVRQ